MEGQSGERPEERAGERTGEGATESTSEGAGRRASEANPGSGGFLRGHSAIMKDPTEEETGPDNAPGSHGVSFGELVRGLAAQGHGLGEAFRGNLGAAVDSMTGDKESQAKYEEIASRGRYEMRYKKFAPKEEEER